MSLKFYKVSFSITLLAVTVVLLLSTCKKDSRETETNPTSPPPADNYASIKDFYLKNGATVQTFTFNSVTGGSFTTPQGTHITIPGNAFKTVSGGLISGNSSIQFI